MSDTHEEAHTGPIKTPKQLLVTIIAAFVIPVFVIIGLVYFVTSKDKPAMGNGNPEKALAERIQKVGSVEIRDANRPLRGGDEVYKTEGQEFSSVANIQTVYYGAPRNWYMSVRYNF